MFFDVFGGFLVGFGDLMAFCQAMTELWEEDESLRKALPWSALSLKPPRRQLRPLWAIGCAST